MFLRRRDAVPLIQQSSRKFLYSSNATSRQEPSQSKAKARPPFRKYFVLFVTGTAATLLLLKRDEIQQWLGNKNKLSRNIGQGAATDIIAIPGLPQLPGLVHGVSTRELGNFGFVTLKDGVTKEQLTADITHGIERIAQYHNQQTHKPLLIVNETAYATLTAPKLQRNADGTPAFIMTLTAATITDFIANNQFGAEGEFANLRDKCISVTTDGFVSNLSNVGGYQLYFAVNTADAASAVLFDHKAGVVGVMACSWHNVAKAEFSDLIKKMCDLGANPADIQVGVGPGLGPDSFEFNKNDARYFYEDGVIDKRDNKPFHGKPELQKHIKDHPTDPQKCLLDLPGMLHTLAQLAGIPATNINLSHWDTLQDERFFSARRNTPSVDRAAEAQRLYPRTSRGITFIGQKFGKPRNEALATPLSSRENYFRRKY